MPARTRIVRIGNSRGIRVPKTLLDQAQLPDEVELQAEPGQLIVRAARQPRAGWAEAARMMRAHDDDKLTLEPASNEFDRDDWEWR